MSQLPRISKSEWEVIQVLWSRPGLTAEEVIAASRGRTTWNAQAIRALINRLLRKKTLRYKKEGRRTVHTWTHGTCIKPYPHEHMRLNRHADEFVGVVANAEGPPARWDIDQVWRIKVSDKPTSNALWRRKNIPGPD